MESVIYELAGVGRIETAPVLVTCVVINETRTQIVEESHVFLPEAQRHFQTSRYRKLTDSARQHAVGDGVQATRALFFRHAAPSSMLGARANVLCDFDRLDASPFHCFRLEQKFLHQMAEIQEWTASSELRRSLAEVMSYRTDHVEAELLARIFNDYAARCSGGGTAESHGYSVNHHARLRWQPRPGQQNGR